MNNDKTWVIAIGRQFGSGGREIGRLVANLLGIAYYDKELLHEAAQSSGMAAEVFEAADERSPRFFSNLWSFNIGYNSGAYMIGDTPLRNDRVYQAQGEVMTMLADRGPCVIVGRTADYLLRKHCRVISVFVHADINDRVARIVARGDCETADQAHALAEKKNRLRAEYYNFYTDGQWGMASTYDLTVNTSRLGIEGTARLIADYASKLLAQPQE
ncbi:MAG: cytidylate kinase-like family protein [Muribaculaceae bacterium]|nr:cytidylate kinase-like family protein [Muribaculaceae bacterium]